MSEIIQPGPSSREPASIKLPSPGSSAPEPSSSETASGSTPSHIIIAENIPAWQACIGRVVAPLAPDSELHFTPDALEALRLIDELRMSAPNAVRLVLSDLHMTTDGSAGNGDDLLAGLMEREAQIPPFALVSGTLADPHRHDLAARVPGLAVLEKDAFSPAVDDFTAIRAPLLAKLAALLGPDAPRISRDQSVIDAVREMKAKLADIPQARILADEVKGRLANIFAENENFLAASTAAGTFHGILTAPDLYDDTGIKLHEFKNQLPHLIEELEAAPDCPPALITALAGLHVYINRFLAGSPEHAKEMDLVAVLESVCNNFRIFRGIRDRLSFSTELPELKLKIDKQKFQQMLIEMLQNALSHSTGPVEVEIDTENQRIMIINQAESPLSLKIHHNETYEGSLDTTSPGGSGRGVRFLLDNAIEMGLSFDLYKRESEVCTSLGWDDVHEGRDSLIEVIQDSTDEAPAENPTSYPNVIFICHDRTPSETFESILDQKFPGHRLVIADTDRYDIADFARVRPELFNGAALVVLHMNAFGHKDLLSPLARAYPHLVFMPVSMIRSSLNIESTLRLMDQDDPEDEYIGAKNVILESDVLAFLAEEAHESGQPFDEKSASAIAAELYRKNPSPEAFAIFLRVAEKLAKQRKEKAHL